MLKRAGHAVQTSVLTGQRAAARAGVQGGGAFSATFTFIDQLRDKNSERQTYLPVRLNEPDTAMAAQTTAGASRVREAFPTPKSS